MKTLKIKVIPSTNDFSLITLKSITFNFTNKKNSYKKVNELLNIGWKEVKMYIDTYENGVCVENLGLKLDGRNETIFEFVDYRPKKNKINKLSKKDKISLFFDL